MVQRQIFFDYVGRVIGQVTRQTHGERGNEPSSRQEQEEEDRGR